MQDGKYFVLHEQRQSGKTSYMHELRDFYNSKPDYAALYINVEKAQIARANVDSGMALILAEIGERSKNTFGTDFAIRERTSHLPSGARLEGALQVMARALHLQGRKFVLFVDEIDTLQGDSLLSTLRYNFVPPLCFLTLKKLS